VSSRGGSEYFPLANRYAPAEESRPHLLREPAARGRIFGHTERHLQAVWFDPRWRPAALKSNRGELIEVESPGNWNLEAGPDFLGAALRVGPDRRRITGDVEVHIFPAGWKQHGHRQDPLYRNVCLHLTYYEGQLPDEDLPSGALQAALRPALKADPEFAFEQVDVTAYPYAGRAEVPPCRKVMSAWPVERRMLVLAAAGHERMRRKAERMAHAIAERGVDQVFYENVMAALGYQHNKQPFLELAALMPAETLRAVARGKPLRAYAVLAGASGLLPHDMKKNWDDETRTYVRSLWDVWWKEREHLPAPMTREAWRLQGIRPLNHPLRRLAVAAQLFAARQESIKLIEDWCRGPADELVERMQAACHGSADVFWPFRHSLGGERANAPVALIGEDRLEAIALNVLIPMAAACGIDPGRVQALLDAANPEASNQVIKQTSFYLFGPDHPSALLRSANRRQGLQQIFHDYCLGDRSRCANCTFPAILKGLQSMRNGVILHD
jgi:hypothetical protein